MADDWVNQYLVPHFEAGYQKRDPAAWGGMGRQVDAQGQDVFGTSGSDRDVERYRVMAGGQHWTAAPMIDHASSDQARNFQYRGMQDVAGAGDMYRAAATGAAPSAAEIYGGKMIDDSIASQMAMAASGRGGPSGTGGAMRQAAFQGALSQQAGARDLAAMRADEIERARAGYLNAGNAYGGQASAMRGADFAQAGAQSELEARQREQNNQAEQYYEGLGWKTRDAEMGAEAQRQGTMAQSEAQRRANYGQERRDFWGNVKAGVGAVAGTAGSIFGSDVRMKDVYAPSTLSDVRSKYVPMSSVGAPGGMLSGSPMGELKAISDFSTQYMGRPGGEVMSYRGALNGPMMSDERAKDPMVSANLAQEGSAYTYKPAFAASQGQAPGEMNYGPMAQNMAADPVAGTAVMQGPDGLLRVDNDKLQKVQSAGIASLQRQVNDLYRGREAGHGR